MHSWLAPSSIGATKSKIALWAHAARLRKHLVEDTALCGELMKALRRDQADMRQQIKVARLDIKSTEKLLARIARSV
jgi:hypothetical protein